MSLRESIQIQSFFWSVFPCIRNENVFSPNTGKYEPEKRYFWTLFTQFI